MTAQTAPNSPDPEARTPEDTSGSPSVESGSTTSGFAYFWAALMILTFAVSLYFMFRAALRL